MARAREMVGAKLVAHDEKDVADFAHDIFSLTRDARSLVSTRLSFPKHLGAPKDSWLRSE
jgi:hypothetical protein